jgi:HD-GYP domain-containing protein (c-di-GMP phosphodiesterase class II)
MIANAIGLGSRETQQLAVGCLLHDIDKLFVVPSASELSKVRQPTLLGYEILKNSPSSDILAP